MRYKRFYFMVAIAIIVFITGLMMSNVTETNAANSSFYGYCYDGSTYLENVEITIQKLGGGTIHTATTNASGYYHCTIGSTGNYQLKAEDEDERLIIDYDSIPTSSSSARHDFDFTNMPY